MMAKALSSLLNPFGSGIIAQSMFDSPPKGINALAAMVAANTPVREPGFGALGALRAPVPQFDFGALAGFKAVDIQPPWIAVRERFRQFHGNLALTTLQQTDGHTKRFNVVSCLNRAYYGRSSDTDNSFFVGSWGKGTAIRPPRDVDIYFLLDVPVYNRFQGHIWNRQSALLQEVKDVLTETFPNTDMRGDGQVVMVNFGSYNVEVIPAFQLTTQGRYWICDTNDGGSYKETSPWDEVDHLEKVDSANARNLRPLIRMLKAWQAWCSVPIKSFQLELLAAEFIAESPWRLYDWFFFDWIMRDFFAYLYGRANGTVYVPGTLEPIALGYDWQSRALSAYQRALKACDFEQHNRVAEAGDEWQKIFGLDVPRMA